MTRLSTAVATWVRTHGRPETEQGLRDLCGGVAANKTLRAHARTACDEAGLTLHVPPIASCTDNAAMIALTGALALARGVRHDLTLSVDPALRVGM